MGVRLKISDAFLEQRTVVCYNLDAQGVRCGCVLTDAVPAVYIQSRADETPKAMPMGFSKKQMAAKTAFLPRATVG